MDRTDSPEQTSDSQTTTQAPATARRWIPTEAEAARYEEINRRGATLEWKKAAVRVVEAAVLMAVDVCAMGAAIGAAAWVRISVLPNFFSRFEENTLVRPLTDLAALIGIIVLFLAWGGLYRRRLPFWDETRLIVIQATLAMGAVFAGLTLAKVGAEYSRSILVLSWLFGIVLMATGRYLGKRTLYRFAAFRRRTLILGAGNTGRSAFEALQRERTLGYRVVGFLDDAAGLEGETITQDRGEPVRVLGPLNRIDEVLETLNVRELIVAIPSLPGHRLSDLVNRCQTRVDTVHVIPNLLHIPVYRTQPEYLLHDQAVMLRIPRPTAEWIQQVVRRTFDLTLATGAMIILALPFVLITLLIKLTSPGPGLLVQRRLAHRGGTFPMLKFRSMYADQAERLKRYLEAHPESKEEWGRFMKLRGFDPRVTPVGRILRRWSLDELPQLLNVLRGDLSLVGPRPYLPRELDLIGNCAPIILSVRPGLTGLWQVRGRSKLSFNDRLRLDLAYVRNRDLWLDLTILMRTVIVLLGREGAF